MANLKLGLLGPLEVTAGDDSPLTLEFKSRALLAYLAVESAHSHRRESLVGLLWPDSPEDVARRNLRQALYSLRNAIGDHDADPPYLLIARDEIQFNIASNYSLDVKNFISLQDNCDQQLSRCVEDCSFHAEHLEAAMALYRGPFLQEFFLADSAEFEEWAVRQREALHRRALDALTYLANYYELSGEYLAARGWGLRVLELDPWREEAHRQVMRVLAAGGERSAALAQYETCRQVLMKELGVEPSAETRELYEEIKRGNIGRRRPGRESTSPASQPALPLQTTPFVGRERELEELDRLLTNPECRLVTLVGPGGIGKTRLALQAAANSGGKFKHGAAYVELAATDSTDLVSAEIAKAVGLVFSGPLDPKIQLLNYLRAKQMLLLIDNVEHLLNGVGLFRELLEQAPGLKLLVTSREQLNILEEWLFEVEGLELPRDESAESFEESSAVALFVQRARRMQVGFAVTAEKRPTIARICHLVGGMPLAIELAATWVRTLPLEEIAQEIEGGLDFLAGNFRDLPERHQSMRVVFDHSWQMLSAGEQGVLARLSIFRGGFKREAAEAVTGAGLSLISALMAKSFLRRMPSGRYDLHELVRQYAAERLHEDQEAEVAARAHHSAYYTEFAARQEKHLKGPRQLQALAEMSAEMENIRIAWRYAVTYGEIESIRKPIRAFWSFYEMRGWFQEARALFGWAVTEMERTPLTAPQSDRDFQVLLEQIRSKQGWFSVRLGQREDARALLELSTRMLRSLGAEIELAHSLHHLGVLDWQAGDSKRAHAEFLEELAVATELGDRWEMALACGNLGIAAQTLGNLDEALERYRAGLATYRSLQDPRMEAVGLFYLGELECEMGMCTASRNSLRESVALSREVGDPWVLGMALSALGTVTQGEGDIEEAAALFRESLALFEHAGERWSTVEALNRLGTVMLALNADAEAQEAFVKALNLARETRLRPGLLEALVGIAQRQHRKDRPDFALVILAKVLSEPSIALALRDRAEQLRRDVERQMTPDQIESAGARARIAPLEEIIDEALQIGL